MYKREGGRGPLSWGPVSQAFCLVGSRESGSMGATREKCARALTGHSAAGSVNRQSKKFVSLMKENILKNSSLRTKTCNVYIRLNAVFLSGK
jgi:hypothetical protein